MRLTGIEGELRLSLQSKKGFGKKVQSVRSSLEGNREKTKSPMQDDLLMKALAGRLGSEKEKQERGERLPKSKLEGRKKRTKKGGENSEFFQIGKVAGIEGGGRGG